MTYARARVTHIAPEGRDAVIAALVAAGGSCVEDGDALVTYVDESRDLRSLQAAIESQSGTLEIERGLEIDWSAQWPARVGIQRIDALAVAPPWLADSVRREAGDESRRVIVIEPAMAFGTGEHETTRGVLRLMQRAVHDGDVVADLGAGSAVLSIAAAYLGASRVAAIELDHDSIANAEENVARNGVDDRVTVIEGDAELILPLVAPVRVILANIISSALRDLSPTMRDALAPDGWAIMSGMLVAEREAMLDALGADGWQLRDEHAEGEWWSATFALEPVW